MNTYFGIADCHGIESFLNKETDKDKMGMLHMRAMCNRQRHAVLYECDISDKQLKDINKLIEERMYCEALDYIKMNTEMRAAPEHHKSIQMIPNPDLDPWS